MILAVATFFMFVTNRDPMDDSPTWEATAGNQRIGVSVLCGASTEGKVAVEFRVDQPLLQLLNQRTMIEWRFDEAEARKSQGFWWTDRATLTGRDAEAFVQQIRSAKRLRARFASAIEGDVVMDMSVSDPSGAIGRVIEDCSRR